MHRTEFKIAVVATAVVFAAIVWMLSTPKVAETDHHSPHYQPMMVDPTVTDPYQPYGTFTNELVVNVNCGGSVGYFIIAIDGKQHSFVSGDHLIAIPDYGYHHWNGWGSCQATQR